MFGLFKKNISSEELIDALVNCILEMQESISDKLLEHFEDIDKERANDEALFFSVWLFDKSIPMNDLTDYVVANTAWKYFEASSKKDVKRFTTKFNSRRDLYHEIYENYAKNRDAMLVGRCFGYLLFGEKEFEGKELSEIPIPLNLGASSQMEIIEIYLKLPSLKEFYLDFRKSLLSRYRIKEGLL